MHGTRIPPSTKPDFRAITIRLARDPNDLMLVTAIRAAVYLAEQDCPIEEEFDGNDLVAAHFIGFVGNEPAGCLRVRFFGEFAKVERLAVRHQYRRSRVSFKLVQASVDYVKRKGFRKIYGQAQDRLVDFWAHFGAKPLGHNRKITFSDFSYTEMVLDIEPGAGRHHARQRSLRDHPPRGRLGPARRARHLGGPRGDVAAAHSRAIAETVAAAQDMLASIADDPSDPDLRRSSDRISDRRPRPRHRRRRGDHFALPRIDRRCGATISGRSCI